MKQNQLAWKAGISREEVSRIERERVMPMTQTLQSIAAVLDVPIGDLLDGRRD